MRALNALTLFLNPYFFTNVTTRRRFEKTWQVSLRQSKENVFRDFYYRVYNAEEFTARQIKFIEAFSRTMLKTNRSTATKLAEVGSALAAAIGWTTTRSKVIRLYFGLIEDIKANGRVTRYKPLLAAEIIDAFAWLFKIQAEEFDYAA